MSVDDDEAALLAELRAISNRSAARGRFADEGDDQGGGGLRDGGDGDGASVAHSAPPRMTDGTNTGGLHRQQQQAVSSRRSFSPTKKADAAGIQSSLVQRHAGAAQRRRSGANSPSPAAPQKSAALNDDGTWTAVSEKPAVTAAEVSS